MTLGGHLGGRLGGRDKTKCVTRVDIRVDTFYIVLTIFTPLIKTKKSGLALFFIIYPPPFIPHKEGCNTMKWNKKLREMPCLSGFLLIFVV